jgi:hypothetical protein
MIDNYGNWRVIPVKDDGDYVLYTDYEQLEQELTKAKGAWYLQQQRVIDLETALRIAELVRLNLAVADDDPILATPIEQP